MNRSNPFLPRPSRRPTRAFTLIELLVVIGILALLGILTVISAQRLSRSSRVSSAVNSITNALQVARAYAIRESKLTAVVFRPIWDVNNKQKPQQTEILVVVSTGQTYQFDVTQLYGLPNLSERFLPAQGLKAIRLPAGIKVAGPLFEDQFSATLTEVDWGTQGELSKISNGCSEAIQYSRVIAVMFAPDGSLVLANTRAGGGDTKSFVDLSNPSDFDNDGDPQDCGFGSCTSGNYQEFWMQDAVEDECNFVLVPFLAVYDDRAAREVRSLDWSDETNMKKELTGPSGFITTNAQQINFNRYTGVAEVQQ